MKEIPFQEIEKTILPLLVSSGVGILPTDTLYGIVASAMDKEAVEKIYALRRRSKNKPMIVLVSSARELEKFGIVLALEQSKMLKKIWPGKVSVVLDVSQKKFEYLHRGKKTLAFRVPDSGPLRKFLKKTGPLVAPSANFEGEKPAATVAEAKGYFGEKVDFYIDAGKLKSQPSTLIALDKKGGIVLLRKGAVKIL